MAFLAPRRKVHHFLLLITALALNEVGSHGVGGAGELPGAWPQFRHGFGNTGFTPISGPSGLGISQPVVKNESFPTKDPVLSSPVIDDDGNVFIITTKGMLVGYAPDKSLKVNTTLNASRSQALCDIRPSGGIPTGRAYYETWLSASPTVVQSGVIAGSVEGHFFRIDIRNPRQVQRWPFKDTTGSCYSAALLGDGEVVIASQSGGRVFALDLAKDSPPTKWIVTLPEGHYIYAGPSVASDATVYVVSHSGLGNVMSAITSAGNLATFSWQLSATPLTSGAVWSCANGVTYNKSAGQGIYYCSEANNDIGYVFVGTVNGLDVLERGIDSVGTRPVWSFVFAKENKAVVQSSPAIYVSNDLQVYVFVATYDGTLYSLDGLHHHIRNHKKLAGPIVSSPAVDANGTVFVITTKPATVYAIDGHTLDILWSNVTSGEVASSPAIGKDGSLYFATRTGRLHRFNVTSELLPTTGPTTVPTTHPTTNATTPTTHATTPTTHATTPTTHATTPTTHATTPTTHATTPTTKATTPTTHATTTPTTNATTPTTHATTPTTHATTPTTHATTPTTHATTPTTHATTPTTHATTPTTHATTPTTHATTPTTHATTPTTHATAPTTFPTTQPPTLVTNTTATHKPSKSKTFGAMSETEFIAVCVSGFAVLVVIGTIIYCGCYKEKDKFYHETMPLKRGTTTNTYESVNL